MSMRGAIVRQFGKPGGLLGRLVGFVMSVNPRSTSKLRCLDETSTPRRGKKPTAYHV
jgi:hypothetical protein